MDKYKNGKIYTIRYKNDDSLIYVGSTVQPLYKRFSSHKSDSRDPKKENYLLYQKFSNCTRIVHVREENSLCNVKDK